MKWLIGGLIILLVYYILVKIEQLENTRKSDSEGEISKTLDQKEMP